MVDVDVFRYRIARLQETLNQLRELEARGRAMVAGDAGLRAQLERWLHLAVEGSMDLARQLISSRGWRLPSSNRDVFRILGEEGVIPAALAKDLEGWAGLRNVLVHLYLDLDFDLLFDAATNELSQIEELVLAMIRELEDDPADR